MHALSLCFELLSRAGMDLKAPRRRRSGWHQPARRTAPASDAGSQNAFAVRWSGGIKGGAPCLRRLMKGRAGLVKGELGAKRFAQGGVGLSLG